MTIRTTKPAINLREELASLRNQGGYSEQQFYFDGLVTNGTFDADTSGWTAGNSASLSLSSNKLRVGYNNASYAYAYQVVKTIIGKTYKATATIDVLTGTTGRLAVGTSGASTALGSATTANATEEVVSVTFTATGTSTYISVINLATTGSLTVDSITVYEMDGSDVVHTMPKGWKPKDVFEDGLLQREGSGEDYEVIYDGFDYIIKPTVAPTISTETTVIGVKA